MQFHLNGFRCSIGTYNAQGHIAGTIYNTGF